MLVLARVDENLIAHGAGLLAEDRLGASEQRKELTIHQGRQVLVADLTHAVESDGRSLTVAFQRAKVLHEDVWCQEHQLPCLLSSANHLGASTCRLHRLLGAFLSLFEHIGRQRVAYLLHAHLLSAAHQLDHVEGGLLPHSLHLLIDQKEKLLRRYPLYIYVLRSLELTHGALEDFVQVDFLLLGAIANQLLVRLLGRGQGLAKVSGAAANLAIRCNDILQCLLLRPIQIVVDLSYWVESELKRVHC